MMKGSSGGLIRIIAVINIVLGARVLIRNYEWISGGEMLVWADILLGTPGGFSTTERILVFILTMIVVLILPIAKIVTGSGLVFLKKWAYRSAILVALVDFLIKFYSTLNHLDLEPVFSYRGSSTLMTMLPIYLIALFDLFIIAILTRKEVRSNFETDRIPGERRETP